jgi:hypothetical protein
MTTIPDPGPSPSPGPILSPHEAGAARLLSDVQSLVQTIRGYGFITVQHSRSINATATLPTDFLLSVPVALDASETLRTNAGITGDQIRDVVAFCNAYGPAADEMRLKSEGMQQSVRTQRFEIGQVALRVYRHAKNFNLPSDKELLFPHMQNMKRSLARGRKKKAATKPPTDPATPPNPQTDPAKKPEGAVK